jgi:predicted outer membrane repeat protein
MSILNRNGGSERGVALLNDHGSNTEIISCTFENNESSNLGGAIFNRGKLEVRHSSFQGNKGDVSLSEVD